MPDYETSEHDVLVIGAGGAGLRAAIEASAAGVRVGLVCKSLLGKAHTVMAEAESRLRWPMLMSVTMESAFRPIRWPRRPIREPMADGRAPCEREAPDRVRELWKRGGARFFDRTKNGRILQRHFGRHKYPRLAHVGESQLVWR